MKRNFLSLLFFICIILLGLPSFAVEEDWLFNSPNKISIDKREPLDEIIRQHKEGKKPIGFAWACHTNEMEFKIKKIFESDAPLEHSWISVDIDDCHIRMDARKENHIKQLCAWIKKQEIEMDTIAFTAFETAITSDIFKDHLVPIVREGGLLIFPHYFVAQGFAYSADIAEFGLLSIGDHLGKLGTRYHYETKDEMS